MGKKRLTTLSHYTCSIILYHHLELGDLDAGTEAMCRLFIIDGLNFREIAERGFYSEYRKTTMTDDMIRLRILGVFGDAIEYDEPFKGRDIARNKDAEHVRTIARYKKEHPMDEQKCASCGSIGKLELDHIVPYTIGGTDDESNLQWLCHSCHVAKTTAEHLFYETNGNWKQSIYTGGKRYEIQSDKV